MSKCNITPEYHLGAEVLNGYKENVNRKKNAHMPNDSTVRATFEGKVSNESQVDVNVSIDAKVQK